MKNLNNSSINKKKILFRADLNIPVIDGKITDNSRIEAIKPSIKKLLIRQNKIFILSHSLFIELMKYFHYLPRISF